MAECEVTISAEKSLISHRGACEFAKRFMVEGLTKDLSPISLRVLWALPYCISAVSFANLGVNLQVAYRLRGASYRSYSHLGPPRSRRWRRFWLLMHSAAGISPLPVLIWLAFPEYGGMDCYQIGMVRQCIIERVQPKDFNEDEIDSIRTFYCDDEDNMFERFLSSWVQMHIFTFFHGMLAFFSIIAFPSRNFYLRQ